MHPSSLKWFARCSLSSKRVVMMHTKVIATYCPIVYLSSDVTSYLNIREWDVFLVKNSRPLPSSKNPHFQNEAKCAAFLVKMNFICMKMKNQFHIKGWALNLVFIQRPGELGNGIFSLSVNLPVERAPDCRPGFAGSIAGQTHYLPGFLKQC